jgi:hypothetical protein
MLAAPRRATDIRRLRAFLAGLSGSFRKKRSERALADEIDRQMNIDDNLRARMTPEETRRDALMKLGGARRDSAHWQSASAANPGEDMPAAFLLATTGYFATVRIRLVEGPLFKARMKAAGKASRLLSESFARGDFGSRSPIGRR